MHINSVANSVLLYLQHDFYNITFKIKHKLFIVSGSARLARKNSGCTPGLSQSMEVAYVGASCVAEGDKYGVFCVYQYQINCVVLA
jgi:hypothetical protein